MNKYHGKQKIVDNVKTTYNITSETYNNLFTKQNGCCKICNKHQSDLQSGLVIDHDHKTNRVRGLLCMSCNISLGHLKEDITIIQDRINTHKNKINIYKEMINYIKLNNVELTDEEAKLLYKHRSNYYRKDSKNDTTNSIPNKI